MSSPVSIHIVTQDPAIARKIEKAIDAEERRAALTVHADLTELALAIEPGATGLALIDIDPAPDEMLARLEGIIGRFPATRFAVTASEMRQAWLLHAMQVGARHFIGADGLEQEVVDMLANLAPLQRSEGAAVTVLSAGGGCGATTVAINLAKELHELRGGSTLLVDLDCTRGSVAGQLGLRASYGVADVLAAGDRLDAELIRSSSVQYGDSFHLLASPATVDVYDPAHLEWSALHPAMMRAREAFRTIVIDAPRVRFDVAETLVRNSVTTLILFEMNVEDVRMARTLVSGFLRRGVPLDGIVPVANRYPSRKSQVRLDEAKKALGMDAVRNLPNDFASVLRAIDYGKTLAEAAPRSSIRREIRELAAIVQSHVPSAAASA